MAARPFEYWQPGSEERRLRLFISHRFDKDQRVYDDALQALDRNGFSVQDMSLSASKMMAGPRGGDLPDMKIQAAIAARIYTSDVLIAPSRVGVGQSDWVTWEVQLAAVGYGIPILFVNKEGQQRKAGIVSEIKALGVPHAVCEPSWAEIVRGVIGLVDGRPKWGMRQDEPDASIRFRGPPAAARGEVLTQYPFEPRLKSV